MQILRPDQLVARVGRFFSAQAPLPVVTRPGATCVSCGVEMAGRGRGHCSTCLRAAQPAYAMPRKMRRGLARAQGRTRRARKFRARLGRELLRLHYREPR